MPTEEQIKQIEEYLYRLHIRRRKDGKIVSDHDWVPFKPQIQEAVLCAKCNNTLTRLLGGHYTYVYASGKGRVRELAIDACERMMLVGKTIEEIAEELDMTPRQVGNLSVKIEKKRKDWEKVKDIEIPKKKYPRGCDLFSKLNIK